LVAVVIVMAVLVPVRAPGVSTLACCLVLHGDTFTRELSAVAPVGAFYYSPSP
jgi:hypothetical protein